jgi:Ca-activated chloride channel family protein
MRAILTASLVLAAAAAARAGDLIPTDGRFGPLRVSSHKVDVGVDNQMAVVKVEQVFANDNPVQLEAHYVFPVPKNATIVDFSMTVNGKLIRGELLEKERARGIYEEIVRKSRDPGLLEHVGANIFRVRVFPILPNSQQKIEMTYVERVNYDAGTCRYVYPLHVPGSRGEKKGETKTDHFEFRWRLASRVPIKDVSSATHRLNVTRRTEEEAEATLDGVQADLTKDLEIAYRIARGASGMDLVAHRPKKEEEGTFMLLLTPQAEAPRLPKDMTFVFDTSGSMEGKRIKQAKAALKFCLAKLGAEDRFNILTFSSDIIPFSPAHLAASEENKEKAVRFVDAIDASGGTNINDALLRALEHRPDASRPHLVLFLTDGQPTVGQCTPSAIVYNVMAARKGNARIFTFGVGDDLNRALLEELADSTQAVAEYVSENEDIEEKVSRLQNKIATPVISGLSIDWGKSDVSAVYPRSLGDLYAGTQLMVAGRYSKAGSFQVKLRGTVGGKPLELTQDLEFPEQREASAGVPYLWAMRKVGTLLDDLRRTGQNAEIVSEIVALGKKYRVATPYTSFLVLESEAAYDQFGIDRRNLRATPPAPAPGPTGNAGSSGIPNVPRSPQEPANLFLQAGASDHSESADAQDLQRMKGESRDFLSYIQGDSGGFRGRQAGRDPGLHDSMGVGSGAGGGGGVRYGGRFGGRENLVARGGGSRATEVAVIAALKWLATNQKADGSWQAGDHDYDVGVTSLSLLAFLGAGYSYLSRDEVPAEVAGGKLKIGDVVKKGLQWLIAHQDPEGCVGERTSKYMYNHAIAAEALSEAYGMTTSQVLKDPAQKAIDFLIASQNPGKGWRYSAKSGDNDTSVTSWAVQALRSAELSNLSFPKAAYDGVISWIDSVTESSSYFRVGYSQAGAGKGDEPGRNSSFERPPTMAAMAVVDRIVIQKRRTEPALRAVQLLVGNLPEWGEKKVDACYWHFGSLALMLYDGPEGPLWKKWNEPMKNALVPTQEKDGSWNAEKDRWGHAGGKVYVTALNAMTLEEYYRTAIVFSPTEVRSDPGTPGRK